MVRSSAAASYPCCGVARAGWLSVSVPPSGLHTRLPPPARATLLYVRLQGLPSLETKLRPETVQYESQTLPKHVAVVHTSCCFHSFESNRHHHLNVVTVCPHVFAFEGLEVRGPILGTVRVPPEAHRHGRERRPVSRFVNQARVRPNPR